MSSAFLIFLRHAAAAGQNGTSEARSIWLQAAAYLHPLDDAALHSLTSALLEEGRHEDAIALADIIAQLNPEHAFAHFELGYVLQLVHRHQEALAPYRRALALDPQMPRLRNNLAAALSLTGGAVDEQLALLESAVQADPSYADAWINLTQASRHGMNLSRALEAGGRAIECAPDSPMAHNNYGLALCEAQRWDDAERASKRAVALAPGDASMRSNFGMLLLMRGDYEAGWPAFEARWDGSGELRGLRPVLPGPLWQGEPLAGKTLLVWGEQGMGDLLQFCRYIPLLAARVHREGGRLIWNSFPQMGELLVRSLGEYVDGYTAGGGADMLPPFDYELPLLSVPFILGTRVASIPATVPYLLPAQAASDAWRAQLAGETRLKVGLTWTGSPGHQRNPFRRVGWERYAAHLGGIEGVAFYSLQHGAGDELDAARAAGLPMHDYTPQFTTFDDTAAFIDALDLVITVCTSVAHLSGALGQRTWVLLDANPHWVWLLDRRDSPWYPSATLYRQPAFGEWDATLEEMARDLAALAQRHPHRHR